MNAAFQAQIVSIGLRSTLAVSVFGTNHQTNSILYGTQGGMPFNQVAGTTPTKTVTIGTYNGGNYAASSDSGPVPVPANPAIETGTFGITNTGTVAVTNGIASVTGSGTAFTSFLSVGDTVILGIAAVDVYYTVASITSDTAMTISPVWAGSTASGQGIYGPYNRPPTVPQLATGDQRCLILVRNESTGIPSDYWELTDLAYTSGAWTANGIFHWNMATGSQRFDGWNSSCASGLPCMPLLGRYDEAAYGLIAHPTRAITHRAIGATNQCVWPATSAALAYGGDWTTGALPEGARLRLDPAWVASNFSSYSTIVQSLITSWAKYGAIVTDNTTIDSVQLDFAPDSRWSLTDINAINAIPMTAWQYVDTVGPQMSLTASAYYVASTGTPITFTITYLPGSANTNFGPVTAYVQVTTDNINSPLVASVNLQNTTGGTTLTGTGSWTPSTPGVYWCVVASSGNLWCKAAGFSINVASSGRSMSPVQDGRWDQWTTWNAAPPTQLDSVTIATNNIISPGPVTIGTGAATTCLSVTGGTLWVLGSTLTLMGNATIGLYQASGTNYQRLTVSSLAGQSAGIIFNGNSGVTPTVTMASNSLIAINGASNARAFVTTKSGSAGNYGIFTASVNNSGFLQTSYCDWSYLGSSSISAWKAPHCVESGAVLNQWTMDNCTVNNCGAIPDVGISGNVAFSITNSTFNNPLNPGSANGPGVLAISGSSTSGTNQIFNCLFYTVFAPYFQLQGTVISQCYFDDAFQGNRAYQTNWSSMDGCFIRRQTGGEMNMGGGLSNSYVLGYLHGICTHNNQVTTGNCWEQTSASGADYVGFQTSEGSPYPLTHTFTNNLSLPNPTGGGSVFFFPDDTLPTALIQTTISHNTSYVGSSCAVSAGNSGMHPGCVVALKNNLFYQTGSVGANNYLVSYQTSNVAMPGTIAIDTSGNVTGVGTQFSVYAPAGYYFTVQSDPNTQKLYKVATQTSDTAATVTVAPLIAVSSGSTAYIGYVVDGIQAPVCSYNAYYGLKAVPANTFNSTPSSNYGCTCQDGTVYDVPMSGSTPPGAHDIALGSAPTFVDNTRNLASWDLHVGGPGTQTHALVMIQANIALVKSSLLPYIFAGWMTTTASLQNAGSDGVTIGITGPI